MPTEFPFVPASQLFYTTNLYGLCSRIEIDKRPCVPRSDSDLFLVSFKYDINAQIYTVETVNPREQPQGAQGCRAHSERLFCCNVKCSALVSTVFQALGR